MKNQSHNILLFIGTAYVGLAVLSLTTDIPIRTVNCLALGAVLISITELIQSLTDRNKPLLSAKDFVPGKDFVKISEEHLINVLKSRVAVKGKSKVSYVIVLLLYSFAFSCIITWPYTKGFEFLNNDKFGVFCTILSLGIIFASRFFSEHNVKVEEECELIDSISLYFNSIYNTVSSELNSSEGSARSLDNSVGIKEMNEQKAPECGTQIDSQKGKIHRQKNKSQKHMSKRNRKH